MKIHISLSLSPDEALALENHHDATLALVEDGGGESYLLCLARGAINVDLNTGPVTITPQGYVKPTAPVQADAPPPAPPKKKKSIFSRG